MYTVTRLWQIHHFYRCLSVHIGVYQAGTPHGQVHPLKPGTPPQDSTATGTRYTALDQVHHQQVYPREVHPLGMYTLRQVHPICRYTLRQVHPCGEVHPLPGWYTPQADTPPQHPTVLQSCFDLFFWLQNSLIYIWQVEDKMERTLI